MLVGTLYLGYRIKTIASIVVKRIIDTEQSRRPGWGRLCGGNRNCWVAGGCQDAGARTEAEAGRRGVSEMEAWP